MCFPGLVNPSSAAGEGPVPQSLLAGVEQPTSDVSLHSLGSHLVPGLHSDLHTVSCPPYDAPPSYPTAAAPPPPPPRDQSLMGGVPSPTTLARTGSGRPRGDPPPYHGHHEVVSQQSAHTPTPPYPTDQTTPSLIPGSPVTFTRRMAPSTPNLSTDVPLPRPSMCRNPHHPTVTCRKCNSVRSSNRQNAAILVRRANSSAGHGYRKSAPTCQAESDTDDTPSILARLRHEWEMGYIPSIQSQNPEKKNAPKNAPQHQSSESVTDNVSRECRVTNYQQCEQPAQQPKAEGESNQHTQGKIISKTTIKQESFESKGNASEEIVQEFSGKKSSVELGPDKINFANSFTSVTAQSTHHVPVIRQSLSSRVKNLFSTSIQLPDVSQSKTVTITTTNMKDSVVGSLNNKIMSQDNVTKKNDLNQLNKNQGDKIELIILEDSDQLKTPKDITKPLKDVI